MTTTMKDSISQEEIGLRIALLRKQKGLSQEDLAKRIELPRSSLAQLELGNRKLDAILLVSLALILGFSIDYFLSTDFAVEKVVEEDKKPDKEKSEERISVPTLNIEKFRNVLLYILGRCAGKPNVGETVLYKLLYFSDFNYYELYEEHLTGAIYRKLTFGPVPQKLDVTLNSMIESGQLQRIQTEYFGLQQTRYIPLVKADLTTLKASEVDVIDRVIDQMSDWSASMISEYSHGDKPWKIAAFNDDLNYELAFYRRPPYSVRVYEDDEQDEI